jgi:hypothetical protein
MPAVGELVRLHDASLFRGQRIDDRVEARLALADE